MADHAVLSASGSKKWLNCTPSARLEATFTDTGSDAAREGTKAHELLEIAAKLRYYGTEPNPELRTKAGRTKHGYNEEMQDAVEFFMDTVKAEITDPLDAAGVVYTVLVEQKLNYSAWAREGFGTSDFTVATQQKVWVRDFKYGKGVAVDSVENDQMMLYGLGAYSDLRFAFEDITEFDLGIIQPRINNNSTWSVSLSDLLLWGEWVKTRAALAWDGKGEFVAGSWCTDGFCKARHNCAARAAANLAAATEEFGEQPAAALLTPEQIDSLLPRLDGIAKWAKELGDFALKSAVEQGVKYPSYKLVEGRSNLFITDKEQAKALLGKEGYLPSEYLSAPELLGIAALEELTGGKKGFTELLGAVVGKPRGKPTLVPVGDKRPTWQATTSADADFA